MVSGGDEDHVGARRTYGLKGEKGEGRKTQVLEVPLRRMVWERGGEIVAWWVNRERGTCERIVAVSFSFLPCGRSARREGREIERSEVRFFCCIDLVWGRKEVEPSRRLHIPL